MKSTKLVLLVAAVVVLAAQEKKKEAPAAKDVPNPLRSAIVSEMPKDAVEVRPDIFRKTDADGRIWIYRRTPFGVTKVEQNEEMRKLIEESPPFGINVTEEGEELRFSRATPFGVMRWSKKKADELNSHEKAALEYAQKLKAAGPAPASPDSAKDSAKKKE